MPAPLPPGDRYVPVRLIAEALNRPTATIRTWARRGIVRTRRDDKGRLLVSFDDTIDAHLLPLDKPTNDLIE